MYFSASYDSLMSSSICPIRSSPIPSASTVRAPFDGLGQGRVDHGVRRTLAEVAVLGAGEVPAQPDHERRHPEQAGQRDPPADGQGCREGQHRGHHRDRPLGQRPSHRPAELVDVAAGAGQQVTRARGLDDPDRQRERVADEVLAELGQHLLAEDLAGVAGEPGEHGPDQQEPSQDEDDPVDVTDRGAVLDRLDQVSQQARGSQRSQRGTHVQRQRTPQQPRVVPCDPRGVATHRPTVGDRKHRVHRSAPSGCSTSRVTSAR